MNLRLPAPLQVTELAGTDSTNRVLKELARAGAPAGTLVLAHRQTAGRGRLGKAFHSPAGGLYLSLLLRPGNRVVKPQSITAAAAVAVCDALEKSGVRDPKIKWVNDIYVQGRKVCGILAESALNPDGSAQWIVLGVGLNLTTPAEGWPRELRHIAGSLFDNADPVRDTALAERLIIALWSLCNAPEQPEILARYRAKNLVPGRKILVLQGESSRQAKALYIDDDYRLVVEFSDGGTAILDSGEVSLKL